ncbi:MAG: pitrilysin family protein [Alphaproteobacteria bacterium]|nr:pitrilysin family protein [Alphaproteobacteria bacterium]
MSAHMKIHWTGRTAFTLAALFLAVMLFAPTTSAAVKIERVVSPGGITAWLVRDRLNPIISMTVLVRYAGSARDPRAKEGLARFTASLLDEGAGKLGSLAFQRRLEDLSISLGFSARTDHLTITLRTLRRNRKEAFGLLRMALTAPRFDDEPVSRVRAQILTKLSRMATNPNSIATRRWWSTAYPGHGYGRPSDGTKATLKTITKADLHGYVKSRIARGALVIGVTGDISAQELKDLLDKTFAGLPAKSAPAPIAWVWPATKGKVTVLRRPFPQSQILFGQRGLKRKDRDYYAAVVMNHILGGGSFSSRLFQEVREKRGLAYSVGSYLLPMDRSALIMGSVATQNSKAKETVAQIRIQWALMASKGVSAQELKEAKLFLTGSYPLRFTSTARIAGMLAWLQMLDLGIDYFERRNAIIEKVSLKDIRRAAKRLLKVDSLFFIIVGDPVGLG